MKNVLLALLLTAVASLACDGCDGQNDLTQEEYIKVLSEFEGDLKAYQSADQRRKLEILTDIKQVVGGLMQDEDSYKANKQRVDKLMSERNRLELELRKDNQFISMSEHYHSRLVDLATLMVRMDDGLTGEETYQLYLQCRYILGQSDGDDERLIVLEEFVRKNHHRYNEE